MNTRVSGFINYYFFDNKTLAFQFRSAFHFYFFSPTTKGSQMEHIYDS